MAESFLEGVKDAGRAAYCQLVRTGQGLYSLAQNLGLTGSNPNGPGSGDVYDNFENYGSLRSWACEPEGAPEKPPPPFSGGQCCNLTYTVVFSYSNPFGGGTFQIVGEGKILSIFVFTNSLGNPQQAVQFERCNGEVYNQVGRTFNGQQEADTSTVQSITPNNGAIDNCGDPTPAPQPIPPIDIDITYNDNGNTIIIPAVIVFAPITIALNGQLTIPVTINLNGELELTGNFELPDFNFNPEFNFNVGPGSPDGPDIPFNPDDSPPDEAPSGEERIVGVFVYSERGENPSNSEIFLDNGPSLRVPRIATVQFGVKAAGFTGWAPEQPVKTAAAWVPCNEPFGAIDVKVDWLEGWGGVAYAIRAPRGQDRALLP